MQDQMEQLDAMFKQDKYFKEPTVESIVRVMPPDIANQLPPTLEEDRRNMWYTILTNIADIPEESPEDIFQRQLEDFERDYYADMERRLTTGEAQPTPEQLYSMRLSYDKWAEENLAGVENAAEQEAATNRAFLDIMNDKDRYRYTLTSDSVTNTVNNMTDDLMLTRALYLKTSDVPIYEEVLGQFSEEASAGIAGASVGAPIGASVGGVIGATATGYVGSEVAISAFRRAKMGLGSASVNVIGERFLTEYEELVNKHLPKQQLNQEINKLVDSYFTPDNREYWGDMATVILTGRRDFLDMGPITGLLIQGGLKVFGKGISAIKGAKSTREALANDRKVLDDLDNYHNQVDNGEEVPVYEGEVVAPSELKVADNHDVNTALSEETALEEASRYSYVNYDTPSGFQIKGVKDNETGDTAYFGGFRRIASGTAEQRRVMRLADVEDEIGTPRGVIDTDETLENYGVIYLGDGANNTGTFESVQGAEKFLSRWYDEFKENEVPIIFQQGPNRYVVGAVTVPPSIARKAPFKVEKYDGVDVLFYGKGKKGEGVTLKGARNKYSELGGKLKWSENTEEFPYEAGTVLPDKVKVSLDDVIVDAADSDPLISDLVRDISAGKTKSKIKADAKQGVEQMTKDIATTEKEINKLKKLIPADRYDAIKKDAGEWDNPFAETNKNRYKKKREQSLYEYFIQLNYYNNIKKDSERVLEFDLDRFKKWKPDLRIVEGSGKDKYHVREVRKYEQFD